MSLRDLEVNHEVVGISEIDPDAIIAYGSIRYNIDDLHTDKTHDEMRTELMAKNIGKDFKTGKSKIPRMKKAKLEMLYKFSEASNNFGDISIINPSDLPNFDYFTYSFPCTDISVAGKQEGIVKGATRSGLLYECEKIIEAKRPKYLLMENVKNLVGKQFINQFKEWCDYLESLGYTNYHNNYKCLNAKDFGIAQNRERIFMVSILGEHKPYEFPKGFKLEKRLKDFLDTDIEDKYYLSDEIQKRFTRFPIGRLNNEHLEVVGTTAPNPYNSKGELIYDKCTSAWCYNPNKLISTLSARDYKQPKQIIETINYNGEEVELPCGCRSIGRNPENPSSRVSGLPTEQRIELNTKGTSNAITTVQKDNYVLESNIVLIPQATKQGYIELTTPGVADLTYPNSKTRRGRVQENGQIVPTLTAAHQDICYFEHNYRIRKLTPRECLRLMGVSDEDITKMQSVGLSDSSLYKLAGNSIVKNVLDALHQNMFNN